jgi:hypothetical protein
MKLKRPYKVVRTVVDGGFGPATRKVVVGTYAREAAACQIAENMLLTNPHLMLEVRGDRRLFLAVGAGCRRYWMCNGEEVQP